MGIFFELDKILDILANPNNFTEAPRTSSVQMVSVCATQILQIN